MPADFLNDVVAVARTALAYEACEDPGTAREIGGATNSAEVALHELFRCWRLDKDHYGSSAWNPLGALIPPQAKILIKPNWVYHQNQSGAGLDCLLTHSSFIGAAAKYAALTKPAQLIIGDAPIQGCDFEQLCRLAGIDELADRLRLHGLQFSIADFRRTILKGNSVIHQQSEDVRELGHFILFDLKQDSLLEPLSADADKFRVTMYNPDLLQRTHSAGRHQYLIAREVVEADVVINLPKLKTHRKACVTGALKNLIGVNGNKEYLPHHRKGGLQSHGDCYAGQPGWKRATEDLLDAANRHPSGVVQASLSWMARAARRIAARLGADENLEGSWYGNDTIWRTCLDLQRIVRYGRLDGSLGATPQRTVISVTDAIIGGEGEGPLADAQMPQPPVASPQKLFPVTAGKTAGAASIDRIVAHDELPLKATPDKIPHLKPAFREGGTVTAANSSAISDGAAALVLMRRSQADRLGLKPLAAIAGHSTFANTPALFPTAPIGAIRRLMVQTGWVTNDIDLFEINEAFAVVAMAAMRDLELPHEKVNVHGGACALGHPIGASGARILVTLLAALAQRNLRRGVAALCIGGGEATAVAIELLT